MHKDGRTRGVCVACMQKYVDGWADVHLGYEKCVPANKITLLEPIKRVFGGNFFCDCGGGFLDNPCACIPPGAPTFGLSHRKDGEDVIGRVELMSEEGSLSSTDSPMIEEKEGMLDVEMVDVERGTKRKRTHKTSKGKNKVKGKITPEKC